MSDAIHQEVVIPAPPAKVYALIQDFHQWGVWSPFEKLDPDMKRTFGQPAAGLGGTYGWEGKNAGSGSMKITQADPGRRVVIALDFTKPFPANNTRSTTLRVIDLPALNIRRSLTNVVLSWPTTPTGFVAEYLSPRMPATNWRSVTNPIITTNGVKTFTNRIGTNTFYRLRKP